MLICNEKSVLVFNISKLVLLLFHIQKNCASSSIIKSGGNELPLIPPKHNILQESTNNLESLKKKKRKKITPCCIRWQIVHQDSRAKTLWNMKCSGVSAEWVMIRLQRYFTEKLEECYFPLKWQNESLLL